jgi:hypothetical protein
MSFDELPVIPDGNVYRVAMVSRDCGEREMHRLAAIGEIQPVRTPTGRTLLTPADGRRLFESLCQRGSLTAA